MKRLFFCIALALASPLAAVEGAAYLKGPEGVRSSALGGAYGAAAGSAESLWYNPAGLSGLRGAEASFTHSSIENAFDTDHVVLGAFLGWEHSFGLVYDRKGAEDSYRDNAANSAGSFEVSDSVLGLGYAYDLNWLSIGLEVKFLNEKVEKLSGSSVAYDLGLQGNLSKDQVLYGLALQNMGAAPSLGGPDVSLPETLRASLGWKAGDISQQLMLLGDYRFLVNSGQGAFALGAEYSEIYEDNSLALRAGWDFGQSALGGISGLSLGAGFAYKFLGLDYTWMPMDALGSSHRIALTLVYDQKAAEKEKSLASYLDVNPNAAVLPSPTPSPTPRSVKVLPDAHVGAELEALMAETPTPMPTPTAEIQPVAKEAPKGLIGAIISIFSFGKKEEAKPGAEPEHKGGILRGFFSIFGIGSSDDKPAVTPDQPGQAAPSDRDDAFSGQGASKPGQAPSPGLSPTPAPASPMQRFKHWFGF